MMAIPALFRGLGLPIFARAFGLLVQAVVAFVTLTYASAADLGFYYVFVAWTLILGWAFSLGLPEQTMRVVSVFWANRGIGRAKRVALFSMSFAWIPGLMTLLLFAGLEAVADRFAIPLRSDVLPPAVLAACGVTGFVAARIAAQSIKSVRLGTLGIFLEYVLPFIPLVVGALILGRFGSPTGLAFAWLNVAGGLMAAALGAIVLARLSDKDIAVESEEPTQSENTEAAPTTLSEHRESAFADIRQLLDGVGWQWGAVVVQSLLLNVPLITVAFLADQATAGIFALCLRLAAIVMIGMDVIISIRGPVFAEHHSKGDQVALQRVLRDSRLAGLAMTLPLAVLMWAFASEVLSFFGVEDVAAATPILIVLLIGRLIYAAVGPVSFFLWMIKAVRVEVTATAIALLVLLLGAVVVHNSPGVEPGFAMAVVTAASLSVRFLLQAIYLRQRVVRQPRDAEQNT